MFHFYENNSIVHNINSNLNNNVNNNKIQLRIAIQSIIVNSLSKFNHLSKKILYKVMIMMKRKILFDKYNIIIIKLLLYTIVTYIML